MSIVAPARRRAIGVVAAVTTAAAVFAGCGGGSSSGAGASSVASFIPAGSPVYFEVSTDTDGPQWTQAMALAAKFPGSAKLLAKLNTTLAKGDVNVATQVLPLLGDAAAVGVFDVEGTDRELSDGSVVAAVDLADGKDADAVALLQSGDAAFAKTGQHDGVDLYRNDDTVAAVVDGAVVLSDKDANVTRAIDAHRGGDDASMAGSSRLDDAFAELPDEVLVQGFVDVGGIVRELGSSQDGAQAAEQLAKAGIGADAGIGVSLSAEADGVRVKAVGIGMGAVAGATEEFSPELTANVPADAIAYVGLRNLYGLVETGLAQARGQDADVDKALSQASALMPLLGVTLDDIKALTSGEHAFIVTKGARPGVVAALEVEDGARAAATLDTLREKVPALLGAAGAGAPTIPPFTQVELANGVTGWRSPIDPKAGVVYGVDGNLALIGTHAGAVKQVQAPASSLADDPDFQAATRQMPSKVTGLMWVDGQGLLTALDGLGVLKDAPADVIANVRPLKNLAAWGTGGDRPTFEAFLTIR